MARIHFLALLLGALISLVAASSAPTFCKCTCFKNSTIIPLGPEHEHQGDSRSLFSDTSEDLFLRSDNNDDNINKLPRNDHSSSPRSASSSCTACTKSFCLSQGIAFCKDATEEDVFTQCFQRDSNKDKIMVWAFIVSTMGLLGWAAFKRFVQWKDGRSMMGRQDINYAPVTGGR